MSLTLLQYNIISYLLLLPVIINLFNWQNSYISLILGGIFCVFQLIVWGQQFAPKRSLPRQIGIGIMLLIAVITLTSGGIYFLADLSLPAQSLAILLIPVWGSIFLLKNIHSQQTLELFQINLSQFKLPPLTAVLTVGYLAIVSIIFWQLFASASTAAILSPWQIIPPTFWVLFFLSTVLLLLILWDKPFPILSYFLTATHIFLSLSIAVIIYKLGYGFDPFIHQAAESIIASDGVILPKTPYYVGQYGLVVTIHHLLGLPILWIDKLLVPLLAALTLPLLWLEFLSPPTFKERLLSNGSWLALTFLIIPFSVFIVTTPQSFANLLFIWLILATFPLLTNSSKVWPLPVLWLFGFAALVTHPLTGIPAMIFLLIATYEILKAKFRFPRWLHNFSYLVLILIGSASLPLLFLLNSSVSSQFSTHLKSLSAVNLQDIWAWWPLKTFLTESQFRNTYFEFAYFIQENIWWMLSLTIIATILWLAARRRHVFIRVYGIAALIFLINAAIISALLEFPEIIAYETQDYAGRLFHLSFLALLPFLGLALIWIYKKQRQQPAAYSWIIIIFISWVITSNLFIAYPRDNKYELGRQYSTSSADIKTVQKIGTHHNNYVVLANQSVSAAAIKEYGFKKYYQTDNDQQQFYYPIPTSSPLYSIYLDMVYDKPTRDNAQKAVDLVDVSTVYFVINEYWENAPLIIEQAKLEADEWVEIDDGKTMIFTYRYGQNSR